jgi:hypothetical protein
MYVVLLDDQESTVAADGVDDSVLVMFGGILVLLRECSDSVMVALWLGFEQHI